MDKKIDFIKASILDIQGTIRALDSKLFGTLVITLLPFTQSAVIIKAFKDLYTVNSYVGTTTCILFIVFSFLGFLSSCLGIYGIGNPFKKVKRETIEGADEIKVTGLYYNPNLFKINFFSSFNVSSINSEKTLEKVIEGYEIDEKRIFNELVFEQCKISYIRDLKMQRQKNSIIFIILSSVILGAVLFISTQIK